MMKFHIHPVTELDWPFDGEPSFKTLRSSDDGWTTSEKVDPFPGYAHDAKLVKAETKVLAKLFPAFKGNTHIYLPAWEVTGRTNGWASPHYAGDKEYGATITLSGKRIPIHPAMTRYLVNHEYGHVVQYWVERGYKVKNLPTAYCKDVRKYTANNRYYGGRTWHATPGEIFANDFRIAAAEAEIEFWPHMGVKRPDAVPAVGKFWEAAKTSWASALAMLPSLEYEKDK